MQELRIVKKQLLLDLDKNEAPTAWRWRVDRFVRFDDGVEKIVPDEIAATPEEVQAHIGAAVLKQAADIRADGQQRDAEREGARQQIEALTGRVAALSEALARLTEADRQYDELVAKHVKPLIARPKGQ